MSLHVILLGPTPYDDESAWVRAVERFVGSGFKVWSHTSIGDTQSVTIEPKGRMDLDAWLQWVADNLNSLIRVLKPWKPDMGMFRQVNSHLTRELQQAVKEGRVTAARG